jgi:cyclophilin family peptidyl-prolyl cis-trans isomerase
MFDRTWGGALPWGEKRRQASRARARAASRPVVEGLEGRQLLTAFLGPLSPVNVPSTLGYQVQLDGSGATGPQTFTATSDNPDIKVAAATGKFLTFVVSHTPASGQPTDPTITNAPMTFQMFDDLVPMTTAKFESFVNVGYYTNKNITRIAGNFTNQGLPNDFVIQGGAPNPDGTGNSGLPGTPYGIEPVQQLSYVQPGTLGVARGASTNSNDTQFFDATGTPTSLNFQYTVFGEQLNDPATVNTISQLEKVATQPNSALGGEKSQPISPVVINSATLSDTNRSGVLHIDATGAYVGETANVTVTATDPTDPTHPVSQSFKVTVIPSSTFPSGYPNTLTFKPLGSPVNQTIPVGTASTVQLAGNTINPNNPAVSIQYSIVTQPQHGTISNFNASTGALTYTPNAGFTGTDSFTYHVTNLGGTPSPLPGNTAPVNLTVTQTAPPVAQNVTQTVFNGMASTVQLLGSTQNPNNPSVKLQYALVTQPQHGTVSNFNASTGTFLYTPTAGFTGTDTFSYTVSNIGGSPSPLPGNTASITLTVLQQPPPVGNTGSVRVIGTVLVVTPVPRVDKGSNTIEVEQSINTNSPANDRLVVAVNGLIDSNEPLASSIDRIVVYGAKAGDTVFISPHVDPTIAVTLDGGEGGVNNLQAGAGPTREHGWFGFNTLNGGTGANQLIGRAGHVRFKPTATTDEIFAANPETFVKRVKPSGTFFKFVNGRLVPISGAQARVQSAGGGTTTAKRVTPAKPAKAPATTPKTAK